MTLFQMDFFIFMLILMLVVGGFCVVLASINFSKAQAADDSDIIDSKLDVLGSSVNEADEAISELNDMSKSVFKELDGKYQELLYLYNLIDEKQKNVASGANQEVASAPETPPPAPAVARVSEAMAVNPRFAKVLEMSKNGKSVEEIAVEMDMGKGEIGLILTLGRGAMDA